MRIFISHVADDAEAADQLGRSLAARGHEVVVRDTGATALNSADAMVVLVSPQALDSPFVRHEIEFALESPRFADRLIPVVIAEAANAPWILRKLRSFRAGADLAHTGRRVAE